MTQNFDLLTDYLNRGCELDLVGFLRNGRLPNDPDARDRLAQYRNAEAERLLPLVGDLFTQADLPSSLMMMQRDKIVSRFNIDERKHVAQMAIALEITPPHFYWEEAANDLLPMLQTARTSSLPRPGRSQDITTNHKADLAALISKRNRDIDHLRGDPDTLDTFGALLLTPPANLEHRTAMTLASHLVAHARINRRAEQQFDHIQPLLPEESAMICRTVRENGLTTEIVLQANTIRDMTDRELERKVYDAQDDVLACAKENAAKGLSWGSSTTHVDRITHRDKISALRLMAEQSRSFGIFSPQVNQVSRNIFGLGGVTGLAEIALVAPEAVRRERALHREGLRDIAPVIASVSTKERDRDAR